jgi:hypothetical protein
MAVVTIRAVTAAMRLTNYIELRGCAGQLVRGLMCFVSSVLNRRLSMIYSVPNVCLNLCNKHGGAC